ncbi:hypothetical protein FXO38_04386 [Capsicum annuum]|nr:hypothetical protein FXO37_23837 [Capsicum annuum]KAF3676280.1 hypothetical protein FXO38_04386 [Capsicum annuum]
MDCVKLVLFCMLYSFLCQSGFSSSLPHFCPKHQALALLQFKHMFIINPNALDYCSPLNPSTLSWNKSKDCCSWDGVHCEKTTGQVIKLDLYCSGLQGKFHSNSSLFQLSNHRWIDLSYNDFYGLLISPKFEILDAINITSVQESTYIDSNTEVADIVKSHFDSELPVLGVGDKIPQYVFPDVLSSASIDATKLKFSPLSFSVKGPLEFDCKVFDRVPQRDISAKFHSPSAPIVSLPPVLSINDCKWVDTGQLSDSFDRHQYNQIKLLGCSLLLINPLSSSSNAPKLFDKLAEKSRWLSMFHHSEYIGEVEVLIECSDNLTSFCNSYKLLGITLENSFLYSLDRAATSRVERYAIDQFRHVRANCKRDISVERYIFENANVFSGNFRSYIYPLSDNMARATTLSLLIELCSSEQVEPGFPLRLPCDFRYKIGNLTRQINLELVISQPARILEWIDSLKVWTSLSPRQEQVEGISSLLVRLKDCLTMIMTHAWFSIHTFDPGILNIHITDDIDLAMRTHTSIPATYYLIAILGLEQLGGLVMEEVGTDAFVNFDKMTKSSAQVFLLSETVMFDIHKSNGPLSVVVKKCILMFFEISENRTEHNNLYEAISKNIQFGILLATNSLALSSVILEHSIMDLVAKLASGLTRAFGLSMSLSYLTVDVVSHMLIYAYTTILVIFTKTKYSFQNITGMQEYVKDPSKFTTITLAPVPATSCDPYGTQTWRKPLETTDAEEKEKQYSMIGSKDVLTHHPRFHVSQYNKLVLKVPIRWGASWITEILHVLMPPIQTALEESDPTINSDLNSKLHQVFNVCPLVLPSSLSKELFGDYLVRCGYILWFEKQKEGSMLEVALDNKAFEEFF